MGKRKTFNAELRKGCAGLFAATLCCVGTALPAFAADTAPVPDPVPTVKEKPTPAPDPVLPPKPDPKPEPKPEPKPKPKPAETTPDSTPAPAGNSNSKSAPAGAKKRAVKSGNYLRSRSSSGFTQAQSVSGQDELAKTGALAMTGGICALALVVGGGGTILARKLRKTTPETLTSTSGAGSDNQPVK